MLRFVASIVGMLFPLDNYSCCTDVSFLRQMSARLLRHSCNQSSVQGANCKLYNFCGVNIVAEVLKQRYSVRASELFEPDSTLFL
jgi:hypothetical protein